MKQRLIGFALLAILFFLLILAIFIYLNFRNPFSNKLLTDRELDWLNQQGVLIYAADRNAPPLRYIDEADGQYKGVLIDYVNSLSLEIGAKIELHPMIWDNALENLAAGKTDMCDMFTSKKRSEDFLFSKPIYNLRAVLAVSNVLTDIKSLKDLKGMTMAMQKKDYASDYLYEYYPEVNQILVHDLEEALMLVSQGEADATLGDEPVMLFNIDKNNLASKINIIGEPIYENQVVFAIPKSKPELIPILNKGIDSLNRKNVLEKIQQKWFGISAPIVKNLDVKRIQKYAKITSIIVIATIIVMATWNNSLKSQIKLRTKELEDSKNDLQIVFDGITEYMIVLDSDGIVRNINESFLKQIGKIKHEVLGRSFKSSLGEFSNIILDKMIEKVFSEGTHISTEQKFKNGIYEINIYPLKYSSSNIKSILVLLNDITVEKINNNKLMQAHKMAAIGELAAGIAHEIRNPLGIIRNSSFILREMIVKDEGIYKPLNYIDSAVSRANNIIDNLLNFSMISGKVKEKINFCNFARNIFTLQTKIMQRNNITHEIICDQNLTILVNQESLKLILMNLISNAIDSMNNIGKITLRAYSKENFFVIECIDTGTGISEKNRERIFNPFFTTKEPGKGTGLGLYIVYNEVKKLEGDIHFESRIGKGTKFIINIPVTKGGTDNEKFF